MKFENLFTSFDLSCELHSANVGDTPLYSYYNDDNGGVIIKETIENSPNKIIPAYLCEELLLKLPAILDVGNTFYCGTKIINSTSYCKENIELIIQKTHDEASFRYIAAYQCSEIEGRVGIMTQNGKLTHLFGHGFHLADALGRLYLLLYNLIEKKEMSNVLL